MTERNLPADFYAFSLADVATSIHSSVCGTGDWNSDNLATWLRMRVAHWAPGHDRWATFDDAMLRLCEAALAEYDAKKASE